MVKYTFTVGGKEIEGMLVSLLWSYGINRIPECTLRVAFIDAKEENENLALHRVTDIRDSNNAEDRDKFVTAFRILTPTTPRQNILQLLA